MQSRRQDDGGNILGTLWCGALGIILIWLLVITIVFGLLIWDAHNRINHLERRIDRAGNLIDENTQCCEEITDTVNGFRPCLDEYCAPENLPRLLDAVVCKGCWNALTNTPALVSGVGTNADIYYVCVSGLTNLEGVTDWEVGDTLKFIENTPSGPRWIKNDGSPEIIPPPPPAEVTLSNTVADGDAILVNPGTGGDFDFKRIKAGRGLQSVVTPEQIIIDFRPFTVPAQVSAIYNNGNDFDPIVENNFKEEKCHYYQVKAVCPGTSRALACISCYATTHRSAPHPDPPGQYLKRPESFITIDYMRTIDAGSNAQWCDCRFGVLDVSIAEATGDRTFRFNAEVLCMDS